MADLGDKRERRKLMVGGDRGTASLVREMNESDITSQIKYKINKIKLVPFQDEFQMEWKEIGQGG